MKRVFTLTKFCYWIVVVISIKLIKGDYEYASPISSTLLEKESDVAADNHNYESNQNDFQDFVKLVGVSNFTDENKLKIGVEYYLKEFNDFHIYGIVTDLFGKRTLFYEYDFQNNSYLSDLENTQGSISLIVQIPDNLVYYNHQNLTFPTDYFVDHIQLKTSLVLLDTLDKSITTSVDDEILNITLPNPWDRLQLPQYSLSWWSWCYNKYVNIKRIPKCDPLQNPVIFSGVLPISGEPNGGFIRKVKDLNWPVHIPYHLKDETRRTALYSISFWLFLTKPCNAGGCFILQQRNSTNFHAIIILHNDRGELHIQLHDNHGNGQAFTSSKLPLFTWTYVLVKVNNTDVDLFLRYKEQTRYLKFNGHISFSYGGNNSFWIVGSYYVSDSFTGYFGKLVVNQRILSDHKQFDRYYFKQELKELENVISRDVYKRCHFYQKIFHKIVYGDLGRGISLSYPFLEIEDLLKICLWKKYDSKKKMKIGDRFLEEELVRLRSLMKEQYPLRETFGAFLHDIVMENITKRVASPLSVSLLEVAGCFGHSKSFFTLATLYKYGVSVEPNSGKACSYHLMASKQRYGMSLMALAYRYQLSLDGLSNDVTLQAGFLRQAAVIAKQQLDSEKHEINTHSELVRLDQAHTMRDVRGESSDLYKWLEKQADMGSLNAKNQIADMLFHGKQGVDANQMQAIQHFEDLAQLGDPAAMVNLAVMHLRGVNVKKNITKAKEWLDRSVKKNSSFAFNVLGFLEVHYNNNVTGAIEYWKKGVEAGDLQSMYNYASIMEQKNHTEAVKYYKEAARGWERNSCFRLADLLIEGILLPRNPINAIEHYRYIAEQNENIGRFMRDGIDKYLNGNRYASYLNYLFAMESGLQLAGYNIALLLKELKNDVGDLSKFTTIHDPLYYVNFTAELGWSTALKEMGDEMWLVKNDTEKASVYYTRAIGSNNHPEAYYNLAYMVEHGFSLDKTLVISNLSLPWQINENLTLAQQLLKSCMSSESENGDGWYPCQLASFKIQVKIYLQQYIYPYFNHYEASMFCLCALLTMALIGVVYGSMRI